MFPLISTFFLSHFCHLKPLKKKKKNPLWDSLCMHCATYEVENVEDFKAPHRGGAMIESLLKCRRNRVAWSIVVDMFFCISLLVLSVLSLCGNVFNILLLLSFFIVFAAVEVIHLHTPCRISWYNFYGIIKIAFSFFI